MPLVSVILCVYNCEKYLEKSLLSINQQTYKSIEIVIVDDASNDNTKLIIEDFIRISNYPVVLINNKSNLGLTASLNIALDNISGFYFARQDADDISHPDRIKDCVNFLENNIDLNIDLLLTGFQIFDKYRVIDLRPRHSFFEGRNYKITFNSLKFGNKFAHGTFFGKVSLVKRFKYNERFLKAQDYELLLRYLKNNLNVYYLSGIYYSLRIHSESITSTGSNSQIEFARNALELNGFDSSMHIDSANGIKKPFIKFIKFISTI